MSWVKNPAQLRMPVAVSPIAEPRDTALRPVVGLV